jgi:acetyl-CoA carboxylase alpha subunit
VYEAIHGDPFPKDVQTAENLYRQGLIDGVIPVDELASVAANALDVLMAPREELPDLVELPRDDLTDQPAWDSIERSRRPGRPGVRALLKIAAGPVVPLSGTGEGEHDASILIALAKFGATPCLILGQDRRHQGTGRPLGPAGLREARRGMRLAEELQLPLVSVIDTSGAELSQEAEEGGLAGEIARCLADIALLRAPTLCLLMGEGTGGGALALLPADVVVAAEHAWLSPLPPEGASAILYRDTGHAAEIAQTQGVRAVDLLREGIVDRIVTERPDAADDPEGFCRRLSHVLQYELGRLMRLSETDRLEARLAKYHALG